MRVRLVLAAIILAAGSLRGWAQDRVFTIDFTNPDLNPAHWTLTLHPDGSGHFHSEIGKPQAGGPQQIDAPAMDLDVHLSTGYATHVFDVAQHSKWFSGDCESHLKVAFQGWKKLSYAGPEGTGTCTFNYSKDKDVQALGDSLVAVTQTILEGARLETLLQHDRLGLDKETEFLVDAAQNGRAQQICAIHDILTTLVQDDAVMERVRKRAKILLAQEDN